MSYANTCIIRVHNNRNVYSNLLLFSRITQQNILGTRNGMTHTIVQKEKDKNRLQRPNWKKDKVYLVQFPVSPHIRSISPFR